MADQHTDADTNSPPAEQPAKFEISAEDYALLQRMKEQKTEPDRPSSPKSPKRQKIDDDADAVQTFVDSLAARDIEWMDLDPQLRHLLQHDPAARKDFQMMQLTPDTAQAYDPAKKTFTTLDLSRKRIFTDQEDLVAKTPTLQIPEESIKSAMLEYHQQSFLPSMDKLWKTCQEFYVNTVAETQYVQLNMDMHSTRLRSLEQSRANRTVLLKGLPALGYSRASLEKNVNYFLSKASLDFSCVAAMHTHLISSSSSIMRLELITEEQKRQLFQAMRNSRQMWRLGQYEAKAKVEQDLPTDDRIALQPFYTMLDILQKVAPAGPNGELQTDRNTLQVWADKAQVPCPLLAQVCYLLDHRFARRYVCVIFIAEQYYDQTLTQWHEAFSSRMRSTLMLIQALQRAVGDKTTVARHSFTKAFDVANIPDPQLQFGYPLIPMKMSPSLAAMLEKHPSLPLQGSSGMIATVSQVFQDYGVQIEDYGKGSSRNRLASPDSRTKGKSKGRKQWSNWQDRTPDQSSWARKRDDRDDRRDDPPSSNWSSRSAPSAWNNWSARPTGKGRTGGNAKGSSKSSTGRSWEFVLCQLCLCALGWNFDCPDCKYHAAPPGATKQSAPVRVIWCPGIAPDGNVCEAKLGFGDCSLCRAHVEYWKALPSTPLTLPPAEVAEIYQVDRVLHEYDITTFPTETLQGYVSDMRKTVRDTVPADYTIEQWVCEWLLRVLNTEHHFLPLLQTAVLPFEVNVQLTEQYLYNAGSVITTQVREHFGTVDYFAFMFEELWEHEWALFSSRWELADWTRDLPVLTAAVIPWDSMVASSLQLALEELDRHHCLPEAPGTELCKDLFALIGASVEGLTPFDAIVHHLSSWINHTPDHLEIFVGRNLYNNETLRHLSAFATGFTDVCFWQISRAYMVHTAKKPKAQHQVPNDALNALYDKLVQVLSLQREEAQWALTQRHWNNKGNSMETLLFLLAEEGFHGVFWQTLWVLFMHQHKDARFPWIVQVI